MDATNNMKSFLNLTICDELKIIIRTDRYNVHESMELITGQHRLKSDSTDLLSDRRIGRNAIGLRGMSVLPTHAMSG